MVLPISRPLELGSQVLPSGRSGSESPYSESISGSEDTFAEDDAFVRRLTRDRIRLIDWTEHNRLLYVALPRSRDHLRQRGIPTSNRGTAPIPWRSRPNPRVPPAYVTVSYSLGRRGRPRRVACYRGLLGANPVPGDPVAAGHSPTGNKHNSGERQLLQSISPGRSLPRRITCFRKLNMPRYVRIPTDVTTLTTVMLPGLPRGWNSKRWG